MDNIVDVNVELVKTLKNLIQKIKSLKVENQELKNQLLNSQNTLTLSAERKAEIDQLLQESQELLN